MIHWPNLLDSVLHKTLYVGTIVLITLFWLAVFTELILP